MADFFWTEARSRPIFRAWFVEVGEELRVFFVVMRAYNETEILLLRGHWLRSREYTGMFLCPDAIEFTTCLRENFSPWFMGGAGVPKEIRDRNQWFQFLGKDGVFKKNALFIIPPLSSFVEWLRFCKEKLTLSQTESQVLVETLAALNPILHGTLTALDQFMAR